MMAAAGAHLPFSAMARFSGQTMKTQNGQRRIHVFSKHLQWLDYEAMAETAAAAGFDGVDLTVRPGGHVLPEHVQDDLPRAVAAVRKAGLSVDMMTTAIDDARDAQTKSILKTASALEIKYYRLAWIDYDDALGIIENLEKTKATVSRSGCDQSTLPNSWRLPKPRRRESGWAGLGYLVSAQRSRSPLAGLPVRCAPCHRRRR